ncbi:MAG TPA: ATP-binding protein [Polyangiaceae bacterium]|nr:ATP-binding protein [Polyangiaceae bacterium]
MNGAVDQRLESILEALLAIARQDFKARAPVGDDLDVVDAIATGINLLAEELDGEVASRREMEQAYEALKRTQAQLVHAGKLAAIGEISSGVAHEINNPAGWVLLSLAVAEREVKAARSAVNALDFTPDELKQLLTKVDSALADAREGLERISTVAGDLRTFARMDGEQLEPLDLNEVVRVSCRIAGPAYRSRARLHLDLEQLPPVTGNRGRLGQVVMNLVVNAAQAVPDNDAERQQIEVSTRLMGERAVLVVEDSGPGIAAALRERVFEPFFTTKPSHVGTGLGLSLVREIVRAHAGEINVAQSRFGGARIEVVLPLCEDDAEPVTGRGPESGPTQENRLRILIVDDELMLLKALRNYLSISVDVVLADGGQEALALLEHDANFDLVLCDVHMPTVDGVAVYEGVSERRPELIDRFVFLTGGALTPRARDFLARSRPKIVHKPVQAEALSSLLKLAERRARRRAMAR